MTEREDCSALPLGRYEVRWTAPRGLAVDRAPCCTWEEADKLFAALNVPGTARTISIWEGDRCVVEAATGSARPPTS